MRELLYNRGTKFRDKEIEGTPLLFVRPLRFVCICCFYHYYLNEIFSLIAFLMVTKDPESGRIYYEDYISLLCSA